MTGRFVRGPWVIGEPSAAVEVRLASADPYRPDTAVDGGTTPAGAVRAASVRGLAKRYAGEPRQDDLCLFVHRPTGTLLVAVADGVSAAARGEMGAALAVRYAVATAARQLDSPSREILWDEVFAEAAWGLVAEQRRCTGDPEATVAGAADALATTLLAAAVNGDTVQIAGLGDSPALALDLADDVFSVLGDGDRPEPDAFVGGGVAALPAHQVPAWTVRRERRPDEVLLLCTDGLALPLGDGTGEVGEALAAELSVPPDLLDLARMLDFSRSTYDDDRTLVAIWPSP